MTCRCGPPRCSGYRQIADGIRPEQAFHRNACLPTVVVAVAPSDGITGAGKLPAISLRPQDRFAVLPGDPAAAYDDEICGNLNLVSKCEDSSTEPPRPAKSRNELPHPVDARRPAR